MKMITPVLFFVTGVVVSWFVSVQQFEREQIQRCHICTELERIQQEYLTNAA